MYIYSAIKFLETESKLRKFQIFINKLSCLIQQIIFSCNKENKPLKRKGLARIQNKNHTMD